MAALIRCDSVPRSGAGLSRWAVMVAFGAEVYLRRLGERLLDGRDRQQPGHWSALRGAAAALVCVGAIGADRAWRVIDDYATATHIRSGKAGFVHFGAPLRRRQAEGLPPRKFRVIDQEISVGEQVLVRDLAFTAAGGTLRYRRYLAAPGLGQVPRMVNRPGFLWSAAPPNIIDSDGNRPAVRFGDGGRDGEGYVDGELELHGTSPRRPRGLRSTAAGSIFTVVSRAGRSAARRLRTNVRWSGFSGDISPWRSHGPGLPGIWSP